MRTKFYSTVILALGIVCCKLNAQTNIFPSSGNAGIGTTSPLASAALEMKSTSKGLLIPRMTKVQRDAVLVSTAAKGLLIYQTDNTPGFYYYSGTAWTAVSSMGASKSLNNLTTTAIDSSLLPATTNNINLGSSALKWKDVNLYNLKFSDGTTQTTAFIKGWNLTGNTGTDSAVNFVGTKDAHPLLFRVNNNRAGYIGYAKSSTSFGYNALNAATTGNYNTATGTYGLAGNTSGNNNTANGSYALVSNTTGNYNAAFSSDALHNNTTGSYNVTMGSTGLYSNTSGNSNTAEGFAALYSNTTGYSNVAIGINALYNSTIQSNNVAIGDSTLYNNNDPGSFNSANENTAIGSKALYSNSDGAGNTAVGFKALYSNSTQGYFNTAVGSSVLDNNTSGERNTATGSAAMTNNTSGSANTAFGQVALYANSTGELNSAFGYGADVQGTDLTDATAIGANAVADASGKVRVGSTGVTSIGGQVGWSNFSDGRYKKNIKQDVQGLPFINSLRPITYTVDINGLNEYYDKGRKPDSRDEKIKADMKAAADKASKIIYNGFIAQDVEAAAAKLNYNFSGVDKPQTKDGLYGLRYAEFVVPLVKAVQELSKINDAKDSIILQQNIRINNLQQQINDVKAMIVSNASTPYSQKSMVISLASIEQNVPNPFSNSTTIGYSLPQKFTTAQIIITDKMGKTLKQINVSGSGKGTIHIDAATLAAGAYNYSLIVDGKLIDTKQMVLVR